MKKLFIIAAAIALCLSSCFHRPTASDFIIGASRDDVETSDKFETSFVYKEPQTLLKKYPKASENVLQKNDLDKEIYTKLMEHVGDTIKNIPMNLDAFLDDGDTTSIAFSFFKYCNITFSTIAHLNRSAAFTLSYKKVYYISGIFNCFHNDHRPHFDPSEKLIDLGSIDMTVIDIKKENYETVDSLLWIE